MQVFCFKAIAKKVLFSKQSFTVDSHRVNSIIVIKLLKKGANQISLRCMKCLPTNGYIETLLGACALRIYLLPVMIAIIEQ